jgi:Fe-S cluster assembly protein SufD
MSKVTLKQQDTIDQLIEQVDSVSPAGSGALAELNESGRSQLDALSLPGPKDEEWRFLKLKPLVEKSFGPAEAIDADISESDIEEALIPEADSTRLVFVNGQYSDKLSRTEGFGDNIEFGAFSEAGELDFADELGRVSEWYEDDYFANLNAAIAADGAYLIVESNTTVEQPVQVLYVSTDADEPYLATPRNLFSVGENSQLTVVEHYVGPDADPVYFNNTANDISVDKHATLEHIKVQRDSEEAFHFERTAADVEESGHYNSRRISFGAKLSRYDIYAAGQDEHIDCTLDGLAVLKDEQISDTHSVMDHREPNEDSHQLHKMILDDDSHAVFNGKIFVRQDAQVIDAYQLNRTLLLSDEAKVNTKPQLEIFADDVVCTHGATVGQLEEDQFFYLRSRGLDEQKARSLLIYAFAAEILSPISIDSLRERLGDYVMAEAT